MIGHNSPNAHWTPACHTVTPSSTMELEPKLKALKVVDLRQILATAKVSVPGKATKGDLIAKILSTKSAVDAYAVLYPPDDLLAPPEE
jgi:SAP domain-containing ribonucleoprotein